MNYQWWTRDRTWDVWQQLLCFNQEAFQSPLLSKDFIWVTVQLPVKLMHHPHVLFIHSIFWKGASYESPEGADALPGWILSLEPSPVDHSLKFGGEVILLQAEGGLSAPLLFCVFSQVFDMTLLTSHSFSYISPSCWATFSSSFTWNYGVQAMRFPKQTFSVIMVPESPEVVILLSDPRGFCIPVGGLVFPEMPV